ncbi:MAG: lipolytic enzyme, G-D-S-L [Firmicutes bacterium]|nr:lipolytic enzyme, G-D-S-L [Bacillota bacterium]
MKKHILCFGDSNTYGLCADPTDCADSQFARFNENERWTCLLQKELGDDYLIIEEGLSGRTTVFDDPVEEGLCGLDYLIPCIKTHAPIHLLVIMLGTNDTKERFSANAYTIAKGMARLLKTAADAPFWAEGKPNILVICPPPIGEGLLTSAVAEEMGTGSIQKSRELAVHYKTLCESLNIPLLDAGASGITFNEVDFMHLTRDSHKAMAHLLSNIIPKYVSSI